MSQWSTVLFALATALMLILVCVLTPSGDVQFGNVKFHYPTFSFQVSDSSRRVSVEQQLAVAEAEMHIFTAVDSARMALEDSLRTYEKFFTNSEVAISFPDSNYNYLAPVFDALEKQARSEVVHVIHYGDSQIEADRITGLLRDSLQKHFGGSGPGLLPLWQPIPARSVGQTLSDSVSTYYAGGMMGRRASHDRYGAMAQMSRLTSDCVSMNVVARQSGMHFRRAILFAGEAQNLSATLDDSTQTYSGEGFCALEWTLGGRQRLQLTLSGTADVYGIEIDGGRGVSVSNIPLRGADGLFFQRINSSQMSSMLRRLNTRLILLEFGGNALPILRDTAAVRRYANNLGRQIDRLQQLCPNARFVVIGPADMSVKVGAEMQTHKLLPSLVAQMRTECLAHGVAFWDMYAVMGGRNSMISWVDHVPAWAAPDYVHFTVRGANKIANLLWQSIMMSYQYKKLCEKVRQ